MCWYNYLKRKQDEELEKRCWRGYNKGNLVAEKYEKN
jgi:hypothetical protein